MQRPFECENKTPYLWKFTFLEQETAHTRTEPSLSPTPPHGWRSLTIITSMPRGNGGSSSTRSPLSQTSKVTQSAVGLKTRPLADNSTKGMPLIRSSSCQVGPFLLEKAAEVTSEDMMTSSARYEDGDASETLTEAQQASTGGLSRCLIQSCGCLDWKKSVLWTNLDYYAHDE